MQNDGLDESQAGIKMDWKSINNFKYANDTNTMAESKEKIESLRLSVKEERKAGLKLSIQNSKVTTPGLIPSWQLDGETVETVTDFIFLGSKITANGDCSHYFKRSLPLGRKAVTNLDSVLKSRDITLPTKVYTVKALVFPAVICGCESWTIKKAECWRIDVSELFCWGRLFRFPWTPKRSNQSIS